MKITRTEQINLQISLVDTVVELHHVIILKIERFHHKIDVVLILEVDRDKTEQLLPHKITDQDMTIFGEIHACIVHHRDLLKDRHIDEIHALDVDHVHTPETDISRSTLCHTELLLGQDILDILDLDHILKQEVG